MVKHVNLIDFNCYHHLSRKPRTHVRLRTHIKIIASFSYMTELHFCKAGFKLKIKPWLKLSVCIYFGLLRLFVKTNTQTFIVHDPRFFIAYYKDLFGCQNVTNITFYLFLHK